jgi:hypothetical protein
LWYLVAILMRTPLLSGAAEPRREQPLDASYEVFIIIFKMFIIYHLYVDT